MTTIHDLGWSEAEAAYVRGLFGSMAEDWDDPAMDVYDDLPTDWRDEEVDRLWSRMVDLERAIKQLLSKTTTSGEFGSECVYCSASSRHYVDHLIHDANCPIVFAIRTLAEQEKEGE